jgi:uncharacterized protein (DUF1015 family)
MTSVDIKYDDMEKDELIKVLKELTDIKKKYNKIIKCKNIHYKTYYMKDKNELSDEEKEIQKERLIKRREYHNTRYQKKRQADLEKKKLESKL